MTDVDSLVEVLPSPDGERWVVILRFSRFGLFDLWVEESTYRPWADGMARQLRAGLAALVASGEEVADG